MHRNLNKGKSVFWFLIALQFLALSSSFAQDIEVSDPRPELKDNLILIHYDLLNSQPTDTFTVSLLVTDENGNRINSTAVTGDIGEKVSGGNNKLITWDIKLDEIPMNSSLLFKLQAHHLSPEEMMGEVRETRNEDLPQINEVPVEEIIAEQSTSRPPTGESTGNYSRAGLLIQSLAVPGLGLSRITGKPHWIRAVAGYGCLAGSVILNRNAVHTYDRIIDQVNYDDMNELFNQSRMEDQVSEVLAYTAIGIWVADIIWTVVGTSNLNRAGSASNVGGFSFGGRTDPLTYAPQLIIRYHFPFRSN